EWADPAKRDFDIEFGITFFERNELRWPHRHRYRPREQRSSTGQWIVVVPGSLGRRDHERRAKAQAISVSCIVSTTWLSKAPLPDADRPTCHNSAPVDRLNMNSASPKHESVSRYWSRTRRPGTQKLLEGGRTCKTRSAPSRHPSA
ncbi:MAG: hypothetical protein JWQ27_3355, partial [Ferruginibacter sp.]|nr:hypothetical protein [Ferruginibacter sp.]